ncbi:MAG: hypothetical protein AAF401_12110 [Pseudomonadota bacterium]
MAHENKVMLSIDAPGGLVCVDVFQRPDGTFGFEQYRRDPEDGRGWGAPGGFGDARLADKAEAISAARAAIPWFGDALDQRGV